MDVKNPIAINEAINDHEVSLMTVLLAMVVSVLLAVGITLVLLRYMSFSTAPMVYVVDMQRLPVEAVQLYRDPNEAEEAINRAIARIDAIKAEGGIVLEKGSVIAMPQGYELDAQTLLAPL